MEQYRFCLFVFLSSEDVRFGPVAVGNSAGKRSNIISCICRVGISRKNVSPTLNISVFNIAGIHEEMSKVFDDIYIKSFACFHNGIIECRDFCSFCRNAEEPVLSSYYEWSDGILCFLVGRCGTGIIQELDERLIAFHVIFTCLSEFSVKIELEKIFHLGLKILKERQEGFPSFNKEFIFGNGSVYVCISEKTFLMEDSGIKTDEIRSFSFLSVSCRFYGLASCMYETPEMYEIPIELPCIRISAETVCLQKAFEVFEVFMDRFIPPVVGEVEYDRPRRIIFIRSRSYHHVRIAFAVGSFPAAFPIFKGKNVDRRLIRIDKITSHHFIFKNRRIVLKKTGTSMHDPGRKKMARNVHSVFPEVLCDSVKRKAVSHLCIDDGCKHVRVAYGSFKNISVLCRSIVSIPLALRTGVNIHDLSDDGVRSMLGNILINPFAGFHLFSSADGAPGGIAFNPYFFDRSICRKSKAGVPYFLREEKKTDIIDLGSGAGFPAIVLSIFMPESRIVLCERMKRRVDFLNSTIARLRLKNAEVRFEGAESIKDTFDIVTSRAFHTLTDSYPLMKPLLREDGKIILYKGMKSKCLEEIKDLERLGHSVTYSIESISVPYLNRERSLLYIK